MKLVPAMSKAMKKQCEEEFRLLCREKRVPLTSQRIAVLRALLELGSHPTAEEVCRYTESRRSGVSRATVYRTLESLTQLGAILKIDAGGGAIRYDGRVGLHHHFVCLRCNEVTDIASAEMDAIAIPDIGNLGIVVKDFRVQMSGLCRSCLNDKQ
jgi:Fur family transcriptional regulator, peroxide stress response regulator